MKWPRLRFGPNRPTSEYDASGAAVFSTYGDSNVESIPSSFQGYAERAYAANAIVFGGIKARMNLFSEALLAYQDLNTRELSGSFQTDGRRRSLSKLEVPWPNGTTGDLMTRAQLDRCLAGNYYIRDIPEANRLERLRPDRVTIISTLYTDDYGRPYREVVGYGYDRNGIGRVTEVYDVSEIAHWAPDPDPCADFRGQSLMTPVIREIEADMGLTEFKIQYVEHAATPNMMLVYDRKLQEPTIRSIEERIQARHGGAGNAFKTLVLDQGADPKAVGNSLEQANFTTVQAAGENRILIALGVPGIVVGSKEGLMAATYSNYSQAMRKFSDIDMRPDWRSFCAAMSPLVDVPAKSRLWYDTRDVAALQAGEQERADVMVARANAVKLLADAGATLDSAAAAAHADDLTLLEVAPKPAPPALPAAPPAALMNGATNA